MTAEPLREALDIIEAADRRAEAADGPVSHVRDTMTDGEWRKLYLALKRAEAALPVPALDGLTVERLGLAIYAVWQAGHPDLKSGLTMSYHEGSLAAAILAALRKGETP